MAKKKKKKNKSKTETTKAPSGLSIARSYNTYTLSWKIGDKDYSDGQWFRHSVGSGWTTESIGKASTSKEFWVNPKSYYPYTKKYLYSVSLGVKGDRATYTTKKKGKKTTHKPKVSAWSDKKFTLALTGVPSLTAALDEILTNVCTFSWNVDSSSTGTQVLADVEWQSVLIKNSLQTDGSKVNWSSGVISGTGGATGYKVMTEDTSILYRNGNSYIRWFRVRSRGPRGASAWRYAYHVYALPRQAKVTSASAKETAQGGFLCTVTWKADNNRQYPVDNTTVQYAIVTPDENLTCPNGASWTDANISRDTAAGDAAVFSIDGQLGRDECLFIRVNTKHDNNITHGIPQLTSVGYLKDPLDLSVDTDNTTFRATVSADNNSSVEDSVLVVTYVPGEGDKIDVGVIPHNGSSITVQCPDWSEQSAIRFEVYAMVGDWKQVSNYVLSTDTSVDDSKIYFTRSGSGTTESPYVYSVVTSPSGNPSTNNYYELEGISRVTVVPRMRSKDTLFEGGAVPVAPQNVTVSRVEKKPDTIQVTWDWPWLEAGSAEISWSDHDDAWMSTDQPESYVLSNLHASKWNISGLETGKVWYVRVRLFKGTQDNPTYGPWSNIEQGTIDLSSAPNKPVLMISNPVISEDGSTTATWVYTTTDDTPQSYAEIAVVTTVDGETHYEPIAHSTTAQFVTIPAGDIGQIGYTYDLACKVKSQSGKISEWSNIVSITIAEPLECTIAQASLETVTSTILEPDPEDPEQTITRTVTSKVLVEMPLTVTVTGAGAGGITSIVVERAESFHRAKPDEDEFNGYKGETILLKSQVGESQMSFDVDDLLGTFDDGAWYNLIAVVKDGLGQTATSPLKFTVNWTHQAEVPSVTIELDEDDLFVKITPIAPAGALPTDVADIYRLSVDKPQLIVKGATFGQTYVDPYPALGEFGGHRIVTRTRNGDYNTIDNTMAWIDTTELEDPIDSGGISNEEGFNIIEFEGKQIRFYWDTDYSNTWAKDFQETQYLGGSIQGDWNAAVSRSGTLSSQAITVLDQEMLQAVRRLATYPGICHVRTADGSSFAADVQVSEDRGHDDKEMVASYSLSITRVDSQELEGMTLQQWEEETMEEEE